MTLSYRRTWPLAPLTAILWGWLGVLLTLACPVVTAEPAATEPLALPIETVYHAQNATAEWWHMAGIQVSAKGEVSGNGRVLVRTAKPSVFGVGQAQVAASTNTVLFLDHVAGQVRVMVLRGKARVFDGSRQVELPLSQQVFVCPSQHPGVFINDGAYRRPPIHHFHDANSQTVVRQFYVEQLIYTDPLLRTLMDTGGKGQRLIRQLEKTGAVLRDLNGTEGYEAGQV